MVMNENEKKALNKKLNNPNEKVICPRCGSEIIYEVRGASIAVECSKKTCIYAGSRGL